LGQRGVAVAIIGPVMRLRQGCGGSRHILVR
jgi:hypothetical protein